MNQHWQGEASFVFTGWQLRCSERWRHNRLHLGHCREREKGGEGEIKLERRGESKMSFGLWKLFSEINEKVRLVWVFMCAVTVWRCTYQKCAVWRLGCWWDGWGNRKRNILLLFVKGPKKEKIMSLFNCESATSCMCDYFFLVLVGGGSRASECV